jgi:anti-sigma factor RsiW
VITINQHNYEEFFLLYVDNELSAADKQAVEQFAQANPDLAIELEMLQQMRLPAENILFDEKLSLHRNESNSISLTNHEEQFLLYVDNELHPSEKEKVETFVLQHPALQDGFTLLKQTRLEPEHIVFADKQLLYREEKKERPVFYFGWQRIAIAAALIGLVVLIWNVVPADKTTPQNIAGNIPARSSAVKNVVAAGEAGEGIQQPASTIASVNTGIGNEQTVLNKAVDNNLPVATSLVTSEPAAKPIEKQDLVAVAPHSGFQTITTTTLAVSGNNTIVENADIKAPAPSDVSSTASINDNIQPAVYKELDTETEDEKKSLLLGSLEINKDKLRGFFRKAGSLFRSKSKTEEDSKTDNHPSSTTKSK